MVGKSFVLLIDEEGICRKPLTRWLRSPRTLSLKRFWLFSSLGNGLALLWDAFIAMFA